MDGARFDHLTRSLARGTSRRRLLKGLAAGLAGALVGARRADARATYAQPLDLDLDLDLLVCLGLTPLLATRVCIALNLPHVAEAACEGGRCVIRACDPGWADCDGQAANGCETPLGTTANCGTCANECPAVAHGQPVCAAGICGIACDADFRLCPDAVTCVLADGGCCTVGECPAAPPGTCEGEPTCIAHLCGIAPAAAETVCRGAADACHDDAICDGATTICPDNPALCPVEQCCGGTCVDTDTDTLNCGACGIACPPPTDLCQAATICTGGSCGYAPADPGSSCRAGSCVDDEAILPATCDGAATTCPPDERQACGRYRCTADATDCRDTCTADDHCVPGAHCDDGACLDDDGLGEPCDEATDCISGVCVDGICCAEACVAPAHGTATCAADGHACVITCDEDYEPCGTACILACGACQTCDPASGACGADAAAELTACPHPCFTGGGLCIEGTCNPVGQPLETGAICHPDACSQGTCFGIECQNVRPLTCHHLDSDCQVGVCDPVSGCHSANRDDGIECPPTRSCAATSICTDGVCHSEGVAEDGASCDAADACWVDGVCSGGRCFLLEPVVCPECQTCQDGACVADDGAGCQAFDCYPGFCSAGQCIGIITPERPCPDCQACQNGSCVADPAQDDDPCGAAGHVCCGGACVANTTTDHCGACASSCGDPLDACVDGECCRPAGSDCTDGSECCAEPGVSSGQCIGGICGGSGAFCVGDGVCASGSCCVNSCCPVGGACWLTEDGFTCLPCTPAGDTCETGFGCCQDSGETRCAFDYFSEEFTCCHPVGGSCTVDDECCNALSPPNAFKVHCHEGICGGNGARCPTLLGEGWGPTCASGICCSEECCGGGEICVDGACVAGTCKPLGSVCDPAIMECCQDGEETVCDSTPGVAGALCLHPAGGSCESDFDCADLLNCSPDGVCGGVAAPCESEANCAGGACCSVGCCRPGDSCGVGSDGGVCIPETCSEEGESCNPDPDFDDCCGDLTCGTVSRTCRTATPDCDEQGLVECDGDCCVDCCERTRLDGSRVVECCSTTCTFDPLSGKAFCFS